MRIFRCNTEHLSGLIATLLKIQSGSDCALSNLVECQFNAGVSTDLKLRSNESHWVRYRLVSCIALDFGLGYGSFEKRALFFNFLSTMFFLI